MHHSRKILALLGCLGLLALAGCGGGVRPRLETAARADDVPEGWMVVYDDYHPRWGGHRITVSGEGTLEAKRWRPNQPEDAPQQWSGRVPPEALRQLLRLLVEIEAWEQTADEDDTRIDDAKARLEVRIGGERASIWEWANDLQANGRIVQVKQHLEALAFEARHPMAP